MLHPTECPLKIKQWLLAAILLCPQGTQVVPQPWQGTVHPSYPRCMGRCGALMFPKYRCLNPDLVICTGLSLPCHPYLHQNQIAPEFLSKPSSLTLPVTVLHYYALTLTISFCPALTLSNFQELSTERRFSSNNWTTEDRNLAVGL